MSEKGLSNQEKTDLQRRLGLKVLTALIDVIREYGDPIAGIFKNLAMEKIQKCEDFDTQSLLERAIVMVVNEQVEQRKDAIMNSFSDVDAKT